MMSLNWDSFCFIYLFIYCQAGQTGEITAPFSLIRGKEREEEKCVCVRGGVSERGEKHKDRERRRKRGGGEE